MPTSPTVSLLPYPHPSFADRVEHARTLLGAPHNPTLFPKHFLKSTFPKLGGRVAFVSQGDDLDGIGFLFPRGLQDGVREFTLRYHRIASEQRIPDTEIVSAIEAAVPGDVTFYDPTATGTYAQDEPMQNGISLVRPDARGARAIRELQQSIWKPDNADALYPADLHSLEFRPGTSLLAKNDGNPVGFLFGFYKFGGPALPPALAALYSAPLRLESQLMGVERDHRRGDVGVRLKMRQAELARQDGIQVVNWTFDPLQYANARLNFCRLGAEAFHFHRNYYDFMNALNQVPASRLSVTWLIDSARVRSAVASHAIAEFDLDGICRLNDGPDRGDAPAQPPRRIAIEVPADWAALQRDDLETAIRWRDTTDDLFSELLGIEHGRYVLTGTAAAEGRCFLVGERIDGALLATFMR